MLIVYFLKSDRFLLFQLRSLEPEPSEFRWFDPGLLVLLHFLVSQKKPVLGCLVTPMRGSRTSSTVLIHEGRTPWISKRSRIIIHESLCCSVFCGWSPDPNRTTLQQPGFEPRTLSWKVQDDAVEEAKALLYLPPCC